MPPLPSPLLSFMAVSKRSQKSNDVYIECTPLNWFEIKSVFVSYGILVNIKFYRLLIYTYILELIFSLSSLKSIDRSIIKKLKICYKKLFSSIDWLYHYHSTVFMFRRFIMKYRYFPTSKTYRLRVLKSWNFTYVQLFDLYIVSWTRWAGARP